MTIVKQMRLFDIHELMEMESSRRFDAILATFDLQPIFQLFRKNNHARCATRAKLRCDDSILSDSNCGADSNDKRFSQTVKK